MRLLAATGTLLAIAAPLVVSGQVQPNEPITFTGYALASYQNRAAAPESRLDRTEIDAAKLLCSAEYKPVTTVVSLWHQPRAPRDVALLDAHATVDLGEGYKVMAGKFLSYLGYESFDLPDMPSITYANGEFLAPIPGYHSGVRLDYTGKNFDVGIAAVDSVYSGPYYLRGDGELRHNGGFEGRFIYKPRREFTVFAGVGYDTKGNVVSRNDRILVANLWASYQLNAQTLLAAELTRKSGIARDEGYDWLMLCNRAFGSHALAVVRLGGEHVDGGPSLVKFTFGPAYKLNALFTVRAEYSYTAYRRHPDGVDHANFAALQAIFRF